jgi:predicted phosphoribosyltransferase
MPLQADAESVSTARAHAGSTIDRMYEDRFADRRAAGRALSGKLRSYADRPDVIVLALPRGGVQVGYELAAALRAPLDVVVVRKLGVPGQEELAFGALAWGGARVLDEVIVSSVRLDASTIERVAAEETRELERRERAYRGDREPPDLAGRAVILVDDGLATGSSMLVAIDATRSQQPARIVVAVPVAPPETCHALRDVADEVICLSTPEPFNAVGLWYDDFRPVTDEEVRELLARRHRQPAHASS